MPFTTVEEKFTYALGMLLFSEQTFLQNQPAMVERVTNPDLKAALVQHAQDSQNHVANLTQVFSLLGKEPTPVTAQSAIGLINDAVAFANESSSVPQFYDCAVADDQVKAESAEIACYTCLILGAQAMGRADIASLLDANMQQEVATLELVRGMIPALAQAAQSAQPAAG